MDNISSNSSPFSDIDNYLIHYRVKTSLSISGERYNNFNPKEVINLAFPKIELNILDWVDITEYDYSIYGLNFFVKIEEETENNAKLLSLSVIEFVSNILSFIHKVPVYPPIMLSIVRCIKNETQYDFKINIGPKQLGDSQFYIQKINVNLLIETLKKLWDNEEKFYLNYLLSLLRFGKTYRNAYILSLYLKSLKILYLIKLRIDSKIKSDFTLNDYIIELFNEDISLPIINELIDIFFNQDEINFLNNFNFDLCNYIPLIERNISKAICQYLYLPENVSNYILSPPLLSMYSVIPGKIDPINDNSDIFALDYPIFELRREIQFFTDDDLNKSVLISNFRIDPINLKGKKFTYQESQIWGDFFNENVEFQKIKHTHYSKNKLDFQLDIGKNQTNSNPNSLIFRPYYKLIREGKRIGKVCYIFFNNDEYDKSDVNLFGSLCYTEGDRLLYFPGFSAKTITLFDNPDAPVIKKFEIDHFTLEKSLEEWHITHRMKNEKFDFETLPKTCKISDNIIHWFSISIRCDIVLEKVSRKNVWEFEHIRHDIERQRKFFSDSRTNCDDYLIRPADNREGDMDYFWYFEIFIIKNDRTDQILDLPLLLNNNHMTPVVTDPLQLLINKNLLQIPGAPYRIGINSCILSGELKNETIISYAYSNTKY